MNRPERSRQLNLLWSRVSHIIERVSERALLRPPLFWLIVFTFLHGLWYMLIVPPWQGPEELQAFAQIQEIAKQRKFQPFADADKMVIDGELLESLETFQYYSHQQLPWPEKGTSYKLTTSPRRSLGYLLSLPFFAIGAPFGLLTRLYLLRFLSVLLLCGTVWITHTLSKLVFKSEGNHLLSLLPAAVVALLPQYSFIFTTFSALNFVPLFVGVALYFVMRGYQDQGAGRDLLIGITFGILAWRTHQAAVVIFPVLLVALAGYAFQWTQSKNRWIRLAGGAILAFSPMLLIILVTSLLKPMTIPSGLIQLLDTDPQSLQTFSSSLSLSRVRHLDWHLFLETLVQGFWGVTGAPSLSLPSILQDTLSIASIVLVGGLLGALASRLQEPHQKQRALASFSGVLFSGAFCFALLTALLQVLLQHNHQIANGDFLFAIIPAVAILLTWSWRSYWPQRLQDYSIWVAFALLTLYDFYVWAYIMLPGWYS